MTTTTFFNWAPLESAFGQYDEAWWARDSEGEFWYVGESYDGDGLTKRTVIPVDPRGQIRKA